MPPSKHKMAVFVQICKLIPRNLVSKHGIDKQSSDFDPWSHAVALIYAQHRTPIALLNMPKSACIVSSYVCRLCLDFHSKPACMTWLAACDNEGIDYGARRPSGFQGAAEVI